MDMWLGAAFGAASIGLAVLLALSRHDLTATRNRLATMRSRYGPIIDLEEERDRIAVERDELQNEVKQRRSTWKAEFEQTIAELEQLNEQLVSTRDQAAIDSVADEARRSLEVRMKAWRDDKAGQ